MCKRNRGYKRRVRGKKRLAKEANKKKGKNVSNTRPTPEESDTETNLTSKHNNTTITTTTTSTTPASSRPLHRSLSHNHIQNDNTSTITTSTSSTPPLLLRTAPTIGSSPVEDNNNQTQNIEMSAAFKTVKCTVCLGFIEDITASVCGHIFCEGCIMQSIKVQGKCPVCRRPLTERSIHPLFV
eukprot:TRINITY_DN4140_c0_g1_i1.p1 TRINITY_DN4140_c0_g1~~TRINITY_DN4140_c0_g1_i1.p1  ORF type:complete len:183 (+),score=36.52 TRINITY_DN4140_c0_g1_i1:29-577(+)